MRHRIKKGAVKIVSCRGSKLVRYTFGVLMMLALVFGGVSCTNAQAQTGDYICSDYEYALVDSMYHACMSSAELRSNFKAAFPREYAIMMADGGKHDCLECRLKAIRGCYGDAVWADMFDDENSYCISHQFLVLVTVNKELGEMWNNIGKSLED